jgi:hypothetical protein
MSKRKQTDGTTTYAELTNLAIACGQATNTAEGRQAYAALLRNDPTARQRLFGAVAARRAAASGVRSITAAEAQAAASGHPTEHGMRVPRSIGASVVRTARRATGQTSPVASGARITEAGDR